MEKKPSTTLIIITIIIIILLIGFGNYLTKTIEKKTGIDETGNITLSEKLQINARVPFEVGQRFEYDFKEYTSNGKNVSWGREVYIVERVEKMNSSDYYVIRQKVNIVVTKPSEYTIDHDRIYYYNKYDGKLNRVNFPGQTYFEKEAELQAMDTISMFAPWMLALTDGFTYREEGLYKKIVVTGRENVNNRESFKVEVETIDRKMYMWVDVEKRILVKEVMPSSDTMERNLISGV